MMISTIKKYLLLLPCCLTAFHTATASLSNNTVTPSSFPEEWLVIDYGYGCQNQNCDQDPPHDRIEIEEGLEFLIIDNPNAKLDINDKKAPKSVVSKKKVPTPTSVKNAPSAPKLAVNTAAKTVAPKPQATDEQRYAFHDLLHTYLSTYKQPKRAKSLSALIDFINENPEILTVEEELEKVLFVACNYSILNLLQTIVAKHKVDFNKVTADPPYNPAHKFKDWLGSRISLPLYVAIPSGKLEVIEYLLEQGADPNQPDARGNTAMGLAQELKLQKVITLLKKQQPAMGQ